MRLTGTEVYGNEPGMLGERCTVDGTRVQLQMVLRTDHRQKQWCLVRYRDHRTGTGVRVNRREC